LHAYLVPAEEPTPIGPVLAAANRRLAVHQRVAAASWWPEADFPRTHTLKVKRGLLPLPSELGDAAAVTAAAVGPDAGTRAVAGAARTASIRPEQTLGELGLDSLTLVELALAIEEKTGAHFDDGELTGDMTVAQLQSLVAERGGEQPAGSGAKKVDEGRL